MVFIPSGYAQVAHHMALAGDVEGMIVTLGLKIDASELTDMVDVANGVFDAFADAWEPHTGSAYTFQGVTLFFNDGGNQLQIASTSAARIGDVVEGVAPQNCARLIKKRTAVGGRANRGRCFIPGIVESAVSNNGEIEPTPFAAQTTAAADWLPQVNAVTGVDFAVVLHATNELTPTPITSLVLDRRIATQRRRLR